MSLRNADETTILALLDRDQDWAKLIFDLEEFAYYRGHFLGMEVHHIEPERERTVSLWGCEHLAIHICHAKLSPTSSFFAKVSAFVKPYPGCFKNKDCTLKLSESTKEKILSFGQSRPDSRHESLQIARSFIDPEKQREAVRVAGRLHKGRKCTWADKVSDTIKNTPLVTCEFCGKEMKNIGGNLMQHQRSPKCKTL
jgi:hypothetical protein